MQSLPTLRRHVFRSAATAALTLALVACAGDSPVRPSGDDASDALGAIRDAGPSTSHVHDEEPLSRADRLALAQLRQATAAFHNIEKAREAGYVELTPCWDHVSGAAMGYHFVKPEYLNDEGVIDLMQPEVIMYEPGPGGQMKLVGFEYIAWTADIGGEDRMLLGQTLMPHSFLPIVKLHVWLWRDNPAGLFKDWNAKVSCRHAAVTETFN